MKHHKPWLDEKYSKLLKEMYTRYRISRNDIP
jgi:hypothetical protein